MKMLEESSYREKWFRRPAVWFATVGLLLIVAVFSYGFYRLHVWQENRRILAEKDRIARQQQAPQVSITLLEGWTNDEVFEYLATKKLGTVDGYKSAVKSMDLSQFKYLSSLPKGASLEGFLFPDTYKVLEGAVPADILELLLKTFERKFEQAFECKVPTDAKAMADKKSEKCKVSEILIQGYENLKVNKQAAGLSLQQLITLASIVEKEAGVYGEAADSKRLQEERQIVAGIFYNRLMINMALESDATINFLTKSGRARSTLKDLEIDSPYNTYKYPGLPPGPIGNPSYSSLYAVLHPIKTDFYFFLHAQPSGEIHYGRNLQEHNENKRKFLR